MTRSPQLKFCEGYLDFNKTKLQYMKISFKNKKLQKLFNLSSELEKEHGKERAKKIRRRLGELEVAQNLKHFYPPKSKPARCHELTQGKAGKERQLSIDLDHPYRLIFIPDHEPIPLLPDGGLGWSQVTAIIITDIQDTHE